MRRGIPIGLALLALFQATDARAQGPRVGVRDDAKLFTREAIHTADASLKEVQRDHGWQVVVRTIESLEGDSPSERAIADEKALKLHGLYVLIAKAEHKVWVQPSGSAAKVFSKEKIKAITTAITDGFHAKEFDKGLLDAVTAIRKDAARAGPDRAGVEAPAPHHEAGGAAVPPYSHDQPAEAPRESYDPNQGGGGDWGDAGSSAPDESQAAATGGGDWDQGGGAGGDWGGDAGQDDAGAGGDWGGNEPAGGDDFGSPDSGAGGDWGGGNDDNQGGSW